MGTSTFEVRVRASGRHGFVDVTDRLMGAVDASGVRQGCCVAFCGHTTCALVINEWESGALADLARKLEVLVPTNDYYAHDDADLRTQNLEEGHERRNGWAHVAQMIMGGSSHSIPVVDGRPLLGRWQRVFLVELDDARDRTVVFHVFGAGE